MPAATTDGSVSKREIPDEILNNILQYAVLQDRDLIIMPEPMGTCLTEKVCPRKGKKSVMQDMILTSPSSFHRANRAIRAAYHQMFRHKALNMEVDSIVAHVVNFNFDYFRNGFILAIPLDHDEAYTKFMDWRFEVRLHITETFLHNPDKTSLIRWLEMVEDHTWYLRNRDFKYVIDPIPAEYVDPIRTFLNYVAIERGSKGPELRVLMANIATRFYSGEIVQAGTEVQDHANVEVDNGNGDEGADWDDEMEIDEELGRHKIWS